MCDLYALGGFKIDAQGWRLADCFLGLSRIPQLNCALSALSYCVLSIIQKLYCSALTGVEVTSKLATAVGARELRKHGKKPKGKVEEKAAEQQFSLYSYLGSFME